MLIDGKEVIYSIKNKKVVYPEIPTEGLVCYLDARGKTNNDKHKGTLLDLSGNGNHGTLQNFSFTEESGYVKDSSVVVTSGLQFDGVDDAIAYTHDIADGQPRTIYIDYEISKLATTQEVPIHLPFGVYLHSAVDTVYIGSYYSYFIGSKFPVGRHKIIITGNGIMDSFKLYKLQASYNCKPQSTGAGKNYIDKKIMPQYGEKIIHKSMLWNRVLTDEEITKLMEV